MFRLVNYYGEERETRALNKLGIMDKKKCNVGRRNCVGEAKLNKEIAIVC